jgi:competence protein ComEC
MLIVFFLGLIAGIAMQLQQPALWEATFYVVCTGVGLAGFILTGLWTRRFGAKTPSRLVKLCAALLFAMLLAFGSTGWRGANYAQTAINPVLEGVDIEVVGIVGAMPQRLDTGLRFRFEVEAAHISAQSFNDKPVTLPPRVLLSWYKRDFNTEDAASFNLEDAKQEPKAGERWQFTVRLKAPHGNSNPHGFDYELWMWEQGAGASGYVRENKKQTPPKKLGQINWNVAYGMERARQAIRDKVFQRLGGADERSAAGVIAALVAGDQAAIERADWDIFRATGVAHLMSISGLHITMFAWLASFLISLAWRRSVRLCLALPAAHAGLLGGLILATLYAWFSGWGVPAQRTIWMLATFSLLRFVGLRWPWYAAWLLAAVVVLAIDPWAMLQPGFWLSFVAVAVLFASSADGHQNKMWSMLREQWVITIALAPLTLLLFQQVSLVGLLANAVAIPAVTLVITPLAMLGVALPPLWDGAAACMAWLAILLKWLSSLPYAVFTTPAPPFILSALAVFGGALLVMPIKFFMKLLIAIVLIAPSLMWQPSRPSFGQFDVLAIDIGQGNAVLVRTAHHSLLFDAGPRFSKDSDAGHRTIVPLLRALGEKLDVLMLSHKDSDHTGGVKAVLAMQPSARVMTSVTSPAELAVIGLPADSIAKVEPCFAGQTWIWDGVRFDVLHPQKADLDTDKKLKPNAISCVLKMTNDDVAQPQSASQSALLTGDIETAQEQALLGLHQGQLAATMLLVPHHGSKTSSSEAFINAVNPNVAIVQAGYRNRFSHPRPEVMARYAERKIQTLQSSSCGAAKWTSDQPTKVTCQRQFAPRYWQHQIN